MVPRDQAPHWGRNKGRRDNRKKHERTKQDSARPGLPQKLSAQHVQPAKDAPRETIIARAALRLTDTDLRFAAWAMPCIHGLDLEKILNGQVSVSHDLPQQTAAEIAICVNGNRYSTTIGMAQNDVRPALADLPEPTALQDGDNVFRTAGWQSRRHTATRTLVAPTSSLMGSPAARRS